MKKRARLLLGLIVVSAMLFAGLFVWRQQPLSPNNDTSATIYDTVEIVAPVAADSSTTDSLKPLGRTVPIPAAQGPIIYSFQRIDSAAYAATKRRIQPATVVFRLSEKPDWEHLDAPGGRYRLSYAHIDDYDCGFYVEESLANNDTAYHTVSRRKIVEDGLEAFWSDQQTLWLAVKEKRWNEDEYRWGFWCLILDEARSNAIRCIDSADYAAVRAHVDPPRREKSRAITDFEQVKRITHAIGRYHWKEWSDGVWGIFSGATSTESDGARRPAGYWVDEHSAYYPDDGILVLSSEDDSDALFYLADDEHVGALGNPAYMTYSPTRRYRLSGHYNNAEGEVLYEIHKQRDKNHYSYQMWISLCLISDCFWDGDRTLYIQNATHWNYEGTEPLAFEHRVYTLNYSVE